MLKLKGGTDEIKASKHFAAIYRDGVSINFHIFSSLNGYQLRSVSLHYANVSLKNLVKLFSVFRFPFSVFGLWILFFTAYRFTNQTKTA
jgi:hypothetical protein